MKYDNFFLPVEDLEACKRFYQETLGFAVKFDFSDRGMLAFQVGGEEVAVILKDKRKFPDAKPAVWMEVENVHELYAELNAKGVHFLSAPFPIQTGWAVECTDPSGNVLGFTDYKKIDGRH